MRRRDARFLTLVPIVVVLGGLPALGQAPAQDETDAYSVDYLVPPNGALLEVGGLGFLSDGRLVVSTRRGQVWIVERPTAEDPKDARFSLFAEGLHEGLGLAIVDDRVHVLERGGITRLVDGNGDGVAERFERVGGDWGLSGNYHEFAFGLPRDAAGRFFVSLNVGFWDPKWWHGKSKAPWRGWVVSVGPDGETRPYAYGFRSPNGIALSPDGDLFVNDNQGDWVAASPIYHVQPQRFHGHPASLAWTEEFRNAGREPSDTEPPAAPREPAAVWVPYGLSRSAAGMAWDGTGGKFGPFGGQMILAELTNGLLARVQMEKVRGAWQGAVFRLRGGIGAANRLAFAPDGSLIVGLTNRGWGGDGRPDGIARVRFTGRPVLEIASVHLLQDGFELRFTRPLAAGEALVPAKVKAQLYDYNYWWSYGSPETNVQDLAVTAVLVAEDGRSARLVLPGLKPGFVARLRLLGVTAEDGAPLLHPEVDVTVNQLPEGPASGKPIANVVPPPRTKEQEAEGWLHLQPVRPKDGFECGDEWMLADVFAPDAQSTRFKVTPGWEAYVNQRPDGAEVERPSDLVSRIRHEDIHLEFQFMTPKGSRPRLLLMGRYALSLADSFGVDPVPADGCGGLVPAEGFPGRAPTAPLLRRPGEWNRLELDFRAPRFAADGTRLRAAEFERVVLNDREIHRGVGGVLAAADARSPEAPGPAPLVVTGGAGTVAVRMMRLRPLSHAVPPPATLLVRDGARVPGFVPESGAEPLLAERACVLRKGALRYDPGLARQGQVSARVRLGDGGLAALRVFGVEVRINGNHADPGRTGTIQGLVPVRANLIPVDVWCDLDVEVRGEGVERFATVAVNGVVVADTRRDAPGAAVPDERGISAVALSDGPEWAIRELAVHVID